MAAGVVVVFAYTEFVDQFQSHYPSTTIVGYTTEVTGDGCLTCHVLPTRAAAGNAYKEALAGAGFVFSELDLLDSDGDGVDNRTEAGTTRSDFPVEIGGTAQIGYNPGLIDCPDGRYGYDPVSMQVVTGIHETPTAGTIWTNESPAGNCDDGLDNDCDGLPDLDDPDCAAGCASDADCDDGLFCNGDETCDLGTGDCLAGTSPDVGDGVGCTLDFCDEDSRSIVHVPAGVLCDDGLFCNGQEICDPVDGCIFGPEPCSPGDTCVEETDSCLAGPDCAADTDCDDGLFCNGFETCDTGTGDCLAGTSPVVDDGVACTVDSCDEEMGQVENLPVDSLCDDGLFCNGRETCDPVEDCRPGTAPCAASDEICDEAGAVCLPVEIVDLDIASFRAPRTVQLHQKRARDIVLVVLNAGLTEGSAEAVLVSTHESGQTLEQRQVVTDPVGNGRTTFLFRFPVELGPGNVTHIVTLHDSDVDVDVAAAQSRVRGSTPGQSVDGAASGAIRRPDRSPRH
jgi:hypothetical protein